MAKNGSLSSRLAAMQAGCQSTLPPTINLLLAAQSTGQPAILQTLHGFIALEQKVDDSRLTYNQDVKARDAAADDAGVFLDNLGAALKAYYGAANPVLAKFGVPVKHPPAKLPAKKLVLKAARSEATRVKRGTMGSRQKKDVRGTVPDPEATTPPPQDPPPPPPAATGGTSGKPPTQ